MKLLKQNKRKNKRVRKNYFSNKNNTSKKIKPIKIPEIFLTRSDIFFGFSTSFSLKKIKNNPVIKAKIEKNRIKFGVFKFTTKKVPAMTPMRMNKPNDFTILKSTALCSMCVFAEIIDVGIIIAKEVPTERCILVEMS